MKFVSYSRRFQWWPGCAEVVLHVERVAVGERVGVVEHEIDVVIQVHDVRQVRAKQQTHRLLAGGVELLVPGVEGDGEQGALAPLDGVLGLALLPDSGGALAAHDVHHGVVHVPLGLQRAGGRDLDDLQAVIFLVAQPRVGDLAAAALPVGQRQRGQVGERAAFIQRRALAAHEVLIRASDVPVLEAGGPVCHRRAPFREISSRRVSPTMLENSVRGGQYFVCCLAIAYWV